ncbi:MAG: tetratricopeptide repeat protein [Pseudobdellovibrio sp.]|nr:tetratricopeptide repeat protein [Pseudobdellovibrio sp.]
MDQAQIDKVTALRKEGSFEKTMAYLQDLLKTNSNNPMIYYHVAWTHDALGKEADAAPAYEKAIALGLSGENLEGALLGLGSTYRCLGDYQNSKQVFAQAMQSFPDNGAFKVFNALTEYNLKNHSEAMRLLIMELVKTSNDSNIQKYARALEFYADKLDQTFE